MSVRRSLRSALPRDRHEVGMFLAIVGIPFAAFLVIAVLS